MVRIQLSTFIAAPLERCFDLARSIDLHMASTDFTGERAVDGVTSGLIGDRQEVTWSGRHFGFRISHTSRITAFDRANYFQDCMVRGMFKRFCHGHYFEARNGGTEMRDRMEFEAPFGWLGRAVEVLALERHMIALLRRRNAKIKAVAESEEWRRFLPTPA
ncbi:MAG TPA: SRPBCC family protein [Terriglobales bacterium]|nr:SRPBCC family protein [Terriglobales bacterium]